MVHVPFSYLHVPTFCDLVYCLLWMNMFWCKNPKRYIILTHLLNVSWYPSRGLTTQNFHLSRNLFQCNPRRMYMCTNWHHQYKLLHSYMDYCRIRWCLQEQNHINKYMKMHKHNAHSDISLDPLLYDSGSRCSQTKTDGIIRDDLC